MLKIPAAAAALALIAMPAFAQTTYAQTTSPGTQNSGAGVAGQPGGKNGPPATKKVQPNTMANDHAQHKAVQNQDVSKVPGKPGSKSGPAVKPPKSQ